MESRIKEFKELFQEVLEENKNVSKFNELTDIIFEDEYNYNNCDVSSGQYIFSKNEIFQILKKIYN